jgi:hypothetical protein
LIREPLLAQRHARRANARRPQPFAVRAAVCLHIDHRLHATLGLLTEVVCPTIREAGDAAHGEARPRYEWITSCRSNMPTNCSIFFARVSALFTVWIRNRMAYRFALFRVAKNAFAFGCTSSAR